MAISLQQKRMNLLQWVPHICWDGSSGMPVVPATICDSDNNINIKDNNKYKNNINNDNNNNNSNNNNN